ncbi:MAG: TraC family protein [Gammaproteobacteria bacterium]|nr:TraC family protein [Gammaproteobacteria bacterium]
MQKMLSKFSEYCGFSDCGGSSVSATKIVEKKIIESTNNSQPLAELLQYQVYDEEKGVFHNSDRSAGFLFEVAPKIGHDPNLEKNLRLFFNDELPEGGFLQFLIVASNDISRPLNIWRSSGAGISKASKLQSYYREKMWLERAKDFNFANDGVLPRDFRTFICYSTQIDKKGAKAKLVKFKEKLKNKLKASGLSPRESNAEDLIALGQEIMQMQLDVEAPVKYDVYNKLSDQMTRFGADTEVFADRIVHRDVKLVSKLFGVKKYPESFSFPEMVLLLGNDERGIPARFVISYTVSNCLGASGTGKIKKQADRTLKASEQSNFKNNISIKEEASEWRYILKKHNEGEVFLKESMQVMITTKVEDIEIAEETLKSFWNAKDWQLEAINNIQLIGMLAMLPMQQASFWKHLEYFKQTRNVMSSEVIAKLPIQGEWKGVVASGMLLLGRRGQLYIFNPFTRIGGAGNFNIIMFGPPGSGKSFCIQELCWSMMRKNVQIFVMDIGSSFKTLCQSVGGEILGFDSRTEVSLNPFASLSCHGAKLAKAVELIDKGISKEEIASRLNLDPENFKNIKRSSGSKGKLEEDIEVLELRSSDLKKTTYITKDSFLYAKGLISAMCGVNNSAEGQGLIERIIAEVILKYGDSLDVTKLMKYMQELAARDNNPDSPLLCKMANSLYPYTEQGVHGRFFKAGKSASFKELMTVFELDAIKDDEPLLAVVIQVILMQITSQFLLGDRSKNFMLVVDEAWKILDYAAPFLESFARTVRKYGGSLVIITQDLSSFDNTKGDKKSQAAIHECSTWKLIGQQDEAGMESFAKSEAYGNYTGLIKSVHKHPENKYAEIMISTNKAKVVGRLVTDPYSVAMYSTESEDFNFLEERDKQGVPADEAVMMLAKEKYGLKV